MHFEDVWVQSNGVSQASPLKGVRNSRVLGGWVGEVTVPPLADGLLNRHTIHLWYRQNQKKYRGVRQS